MFAAGYSGDLAMRLLARGCCLTVALLSAGGALATSAVTPDANAGMVASDRKSVAHEVLEDVLRQESEKPEAVSADPSSGNGGASRATTRLADQEKAPRDGMFLLLLQILRSPK